MLEPEEVAEAVVKVEATSALANSSIVRAAKKSAPRQRKKSR